MSVPHTMDPEPHFYLLLMGLLFFVVTLYPTGVILGFCGVILCLSVVALHLFLVILHHAVVVLSLSEVILCYSVLFVDSFKVLSELQCLLEVTEHYIITINVF